MLSTFSAVVRGAPFDPSSADWEGCSRLLEIARDELGSSRVRVADEIDYGHLDPADAILLIHPQGAFDVDELATFMKIGGRVAVADDFGDGDRLLDRFRIKRTAAPLDPLQMLHGNPQLPIAVPASNHPIVADLSLLALNHPTVISHPDLSPLLRVPRAGGDPGPNVALAGQVNDGRLVAIGDPSIFINSMLRFPGNKNLARNLVAYLLDRSGERRHPGARGRLTIVVNHFSERGTLGRGVTGSLRDRLRGMIITIDNVRREGFGGPASRMLALGVALAAAIWVAARAALRTAMPRPHYAAYTSPENERALSVHTRDARFASLLVDDGRADGPLPWWRAPPFDRIRFRRAPRLTAAGYDVLANAFEATIAAREDLAPLPRPAAFRRLAVEAGLGEGDLRRAERAFARLREGTSAMPATAGRVPSVRAISRPSYRDISLLGRVLGPVADSLRASR